MLNFDFCGVEIIDVKMDQRRARSTSFEIDAVTIKIWLNISKEVLQLRNTSLISGHIGIRQNSPRKGIIISYADQDISWLTMFGNDSDMLLLEWAYVQGHF